MANEPSREVGSAALSSSSALGQDSGLEVVKARSLPCTTALTVVTAGGGDERFSWAVAEAQGRRADMEDAHAVCLDLDGRGGALFGLFDGHAGREVSSFCAQHVASCLAASPAYRGGDVAGGLREAFLSLDDMLRDPKYRQELYAYRKRLDESPAGPPGASPGPVPGDSESPPPEEPPRHDPLSSAAAAARAQDESEAAAALEAEEAAPYRVDDLGEDAGAPVEITPGDTRSEDLPPAHRKAAAKYGMRDEQGRFLGSKAGSTAVVAVVQGSRLLVASAGDSRAVLCVDGKAVPLTQDHKPDMPEEAERIYAAGLFVAARPGGVARVAGALAMSRAMGDFKYKAHPALPPDQQAVTALPDLSYEVDVAARSGAPFLLLGCDGLWDVMDHQQAIDLLLEQLRGGASLRAAVQALVSEALTGDARGRTPSPKAVRGGLSYDNVTVMLIAFHAAV